MDKIKVIFGKVEEKRKAFNDKRNEKAQGTFKGLEEIIAKRKQESQGYASKNR
jgi:hypothetical protein